MEERQAEDRPGRGVRFIHDDASDEDFFGSHERVAKAVAQALRDDAELRVLGVIGPWGSGKSTVVRLLGQQLSTPKPGFVVYEHDAWLHQSDPPRRALFEGLLSFFVASGRVRAAAWRDRLDGLMQRVDEQEVTTTPKLGGPAIALLLALLVSAIGLKFIEPKWIGRTLAWRDTTRWVFPAGLALLTAPAAVAAAILYWWRPERRVWHPKGFFATDNWRRHREPHERDSLLAILVGRAPPRQSSRTVRSPEPTTIEFQKAVRDLLSQALRPEERLLVVIDNLDRLEHDECVLMWTTVRSILLGPGDAEGTRPVPAPSVLLPLDAEAVVRLYGRKDGGSQAIRSLMDKTFDAVFHVAAPTLPNWKSYLERQLRHAFSGTSADTKSFEIGRLYARHRPGDVTPRSLNRFVNELAALWLTWRDQTFPLPTMAQFVLLRESFDTQLLETIANAPLDVTENDPEWRRSIAAMKFGVPPGDALQVLLSSQLVVALGDKDDEEFVKLAGIPGFGDAIVDALEDDRLPPPRVRRLAELLDAGDFVGPGWPARAWRLLRTRYLKEGLTGFEEQSPGALMELLLARAGPREAQRFMFDLSRLLRPSADLIARSSKAFSERTMARRWLELAQSLPLTGPGTVATADPVAFLDLAAEALAAGLPVERLAFEGPEADLAVSLANAFEKDPHLADPLEKALLVTGFEGLTAPSLEQLAHASSALLQKDEAGTMSRRAAAHVLGVVRAMPGRFDLPLRLLVQNGLDERLARALRTGETSLAGQLAALAILEGAAVTDLPSLYGALTEEEQGAFLDELDADLDAYSEQGAYDERHRLPRFTPVPSRERRRGREELEALLGG